MTTSALPLTNNADESSSTCTDGPNVVATKSATKIKTHPAPTAPYRLGIRCFRVQDKLL